MDDRRRADSGYQKPIAKKNTADQPDGDDDNSEAIPRVPHNKQKPIPGKGIQQKKTIH